MGHQAAVELLIKSNVFDIDIKNGSFSTPLRQACIYLQPAAVFTLVENGADFNFRPSAGLSSIGETAWAIRLVILDDILTLNIWWFHFRSATKISENSVDLVQLG